MHFLFSKINLSCFFRCWWRSLRGYTLPPIHRNPPFLPWRIFLSVCRNSQRTCAISTGRIWKRIKQKDRYKPDPSHTEKLLSHDPGKRENHDSSPSNSVWWQSYTTVAYNQEKSSRQFSFGGSAIQTGSTVLATYSGLHAIPHLYPIVHIKGNSTPNTYNITL